MQMIQPFDEAFIIFPHVTQTPKDTLTSDHMFYKHQSKGRDRDREREGGRKGE